ncbi:hypothetical protein CTI14_71505, partial [Methylobacterium radiotolerans]
MPRLRHGAGLVLRRLPDAARADGLTWTTCLFFAPWRARCLAYATAPALFYVACLMLRELT